ncbi:MAG: ATP-binding protein [Pseudomonadota bacterium]
MERSSKVADRQLAPPDEVSYKVSCGGDDACPQSQSALGQSTLVAQSVPLVAHGPPDLKSLTAALIGAAFYFALAYLSIALSRFDTALATIWLPSAAAVAFLLRMKLANEAAFYAAAFTASFLANALKGNEMSVSLIFSLANMANVMLVTWLTRRHCGDAPDMSDLGTLARFVWIGGLVGPLTAASIAALAMGPGMDFHFVGEADGNASGVWEGALSWFLTDSMGMVLLVPTVMLITDTMTKELLPSLKSAAECAILLGSSLLCVVLVFGQKAYPLLFLIVPITLVHAFRLGSAGTALHVLLVAAVSTGMTWAGYGPIIETSASPTARLHLLQAFIAANFLTGLPIAAILAGRDRLTEAVTEGRRELALLADNITDAVLTLDNKGVCTYASPSVFEVLGRSQSDFIGAPLDALADEDAGQRIKGALERLLSGKSEKERLTYRRQFDDDAGGAVYVEADCALTYDLASGEREGIVISARDVTERVELELLLTSARLHAEKAANAKSDFLANMSHEIRTPMNGVLGFAELMLQGELDKEQRRHAEMIVESGRSMMLLLNDVLDLSKIEAGQIAIDASPIDLHATLEQCAALHRQTAELKGLNLRLEYELNPLSKGGHASAEAPANPACANLLPTVVTDGLRLRQIVLNLIGNAVKFTEAGDIRVSYWVEEEQLGVCVQDTGIGIGGGRIETIFEPFTQADSDIARRFGGTGLGLSISRRLAEMLGGSIEVESESGAGSRFTLILPTTVIAPDDAPQSPQAALALEDLPPLARILLVEDHDVNRMLVSEMLERCGQNVAIAHDGNEAISMVIDGVIRARPFELVLMDIQMPDCDGYEATRAIREEGIKADTLPIIALTANAFPEDVAAAREAGMQGHLAKPVVLADLVAMLQRWLPTRIVETPMDRDVSLGADPAKSEDADPALEPGDDMEAYAEASAETSEDGQREDGQIIPLDAASPPPSTDQPSKNHRPLHKASLQERWLVRRFEAVEAVRTALADGLICNDGKRRAVDREEREALIGIVHKLAGSAASFGERALGEMAAQLEHAMRTKAPCEQCEALAFELLAMADEPDSAPSQSANSQS